MTAMSDSRGEVFQWDGLWIHDTGCANCDRRFTDHTWETCPSFVDGYQVGDCDLIADDELVQYAAYWYSLGEPDRICEACATGTGGATYQAFVLEPMSAGNLN